MTTETRRIVLWSLALAIVIEAVTCVIRFGFDLQSTRDSAALARFTHGLRIHHGYVGIVLMVVAACLKPSPIRTGMGIVGGALAASDLAHHVLVLWPITGSPQFDLTY